jgi:hypothetical protein
MILQAEFVEETGPLDPMTPSLFRNRAKPDGSDFPIRNLFLFYRYAAARSRPKTVTNALRRAPSFRTRRPPESSIRLDVCDLRTDMDGDGFGSPAYPASACTLEDCPLESNPTQPYGQNRGRGFVSHRLRLSLAKTQSGCLDDDFREARAWSKRLDSAE